MLKVKIFSGSPSDIQTDFNKWSAQNDVVIQTAQYVNAADSDRLVVFYVDKIELPMPSKRPSPILVPKMAMAKP
jgi:hypothetical protein